MADHGDALGPLCLDPARVSGRRCAAGWSPADLAERLGCQQRVVTRLERGLIRPSWRLLARLSATLGCPESDLYGDQEQGALPTELGPAGDAWVREQLAQAPMAGEIDEVRALRLSALLFPGG